MHEGSTYVHIHAEQSWRSGDLNATFKAEQQTDQVS